MSDNSIFLGDTEDLGGGTKLVMSTGFDAGGRSAGGTGNFGQENSSLTVSGNFGSVKLMSFESDGPLANIDALSGASLDYGVFDSQAVGVAKRYRNGVSYNTPAFSGFTGGLTYVTLAGQFVPTSDSDAKTKIVPSLKYANGPLVAYVEDAFFNPSYPSAQNATQPTVYATYDFGVAQIGAGWTKPSTGDATTALGLSVPVSDKLVLGVATFAYTSSAAQGTADWTEASIAYNLSKRTSLKASFGQINDAALHYAQTYSGNSVYALSGSNFVQDSQSRIGLFHSF